MRKVESKPANGTFWKLCLKVAHPLLAFTAGFTLLSLIGWTGEVTSWQNVLTFLTGLVFTIERARTFRRARTEGNAGLRLGLRAVLTILTIAGTGLIGFHALQGKEDHLLGLHVLVLMVVGVSGLSSMVGHQAKLTARAFHPGWLLIGSFLVIIVVGGLLLKMPLCTRAGVSCSWLDAFFTSTSAVCVTGLNTQNPGLYFSTTGQMIVLLLIQIGGLGIMTLTFFAAVVLFQGLSLHDRLLLGKMIQENRLARIGETLSFIVGMTFCCEAVGALILYASLDSIPHSGWRVFHSVFHAVSAFCNAGFSTLPDNLASEAVRGNGIWQGVIMGLIVIGGLGSLVCEDVCLWIKARLSRRMKHRGPLPRLRVHTRLVLVVNTMLIVGGALAFLVTEFGIHTGPENAGKWMTAMFHSVTARTAGFNTVSMSAIGPLTVQLLILLMLIGGSPGGTAGGMRTTVFAIGFAHLWDQLRGGMRGMVFFHRRIPNDTGARALGVILLTGVWLILNFVGLQVLQSGSGITETRLLFELVSAFATVGLSLDLTPLLSDGAKWLLIVNMFVGRIGLLTLTCALIKPDPRPTSGKPEEDILLT